MTQDVEKSHERGKGNPLSLSSKDRADGFSVVTDDGNNITLLRWGKPIALPGETGKMPHQREIHHRSSKALSRDIKLDDLFYLAPDGSQDDRRE